MTLATDKRKLTDLAIKALNPAQPGKRYIVWDEMTPHLGLRVTDKGAKSFIVVRRMKDRPQPYTHVFDRWPNMSLAQARTATPAILADLREGTTPKAKAKAAREQQAASDKNTFAIAVERFIEYQKGKALRRWRSTEAILRRHFLGQTWTGRRGPNGEWFIKWQPGPDPLWSAKPVASITRDDIVEILDGIENRFAKRSALASVRALFGWAQELKRFGIEVSPALGMRDRTLGITAKQLRRQRTLDDSEIRSVWAAALGMGYPYGDLVRVLLLTGQRLNDWARASWHEFDEANSRLTIPAERFKTDVVQEVEAGPMVLELLASLPRFVGPYLFSSTYGQKPISTFHPPKQALQVVINAQRERGGLPAMKPWVLHDLRRTVRTRLGSDCGVDAYIAERVIGHKLGGLDAVYDQGAYRPQRRAALIAWEQMLWAILNPQLADGGNVVELKLRAQ